MIDIWLNDLAYAARGLRKNAGFAAVATITIALGIGACTAIFSVVNAVLMRPLPYADAQRLVVIWGEHRARIVSDWPCSPPDLRDLQQQSSTIFDDIVGMIPADRVPIAGLGREPEQIRVGGANQLRHGEPQQRRLSRHRPAEAGRHDRTGAAAGRSRGI